MNTQLRILPGYKQRQEGVAGKRGTAGTVCEGVPEGGKVKASLFFRLKGIDCLFLFVVCSSVTLGYTVCILCINLQVCVCVCVCVCREVAGCSNTYSVCSKQEGRQTDK